MNAFTLLLALGVGAAFFAVLRRLAVVEQELRRVESLVARLEERESRFVAAPPPSVADVTTEAPPAQPAQQGRTPAIVRSSPPAERPPVVAASVSAPVRTAPAATPLNLESLIGGRLPIWIGGAALVLAGFFLVRYSIDSGLLRPAVRTLLAALFGAVLIAASEAARRLRATAEDPRVAQVLAGAGIASLYGTLYMAAALYHLIAPLTAFVAVVLVTAAAMGLALRHGPPTAVMALIGGFVAPLVAGFDAAGIGPLLVYLGLFIAALFGLAIHRGWGWLALAASIAGFGWINFLIAALPGRGGDLSAVGAFTMLLAVCASAALPATGTQNRWLRLAPLVAGFVQLLALAPSLEFGALAWSFYLVLAGAALFLSWRQAVYLPAALAALGFLLMLEALALLQPERSATPLAAAVASLLFAVPGHLLAGRGRGWAAIATGGTAGPLLVAHACAPSLLAAEVWGVLELLAAAACAALAWRLKRDENDPALIAASLVTGLLVALGLAQFLPAAWLGLPLALVLLAFAGWARTAGAPGLFVLPALPFIAALLAAAVPLLGLARLVGESVSGDPLPYLDIPALPDLFRALALPTAALLATLLDQRQLGRFRRVVGSIAIGIAILLVYALAKQVLAIATPERFESLGFVERALLTQSCFAVGWALLNKGRFRSLGTVLFALGVFRIVWFDLLLLDPVLVPQAVGTVPLLNAAFVHAALAAFWLWTVAQIPGHRVGAALLSLVAALVAVRQATHGNVLTGPVGTLENGGYSAASLAVALFWLWRGISVGVHDLRLAGLALLTLVTFKVFLIDAAALDGVLRILSFLALGVVLIGISWSYSRFLARPAASEGKAEAVAD
ncbi:DUF2339 domain-containing protein [Sphingomonas psychrotolerans]|uniref:DUF2339 domain-containing protein n=1 Tax=Sphingomonas psychrotolerans TaxID=1327635 RepID=A0ABU3N555_9SPHN|nr:DUF2339 domain-containing protein [Sphingomonas psychrotolerans]MDT8758994.1 DUF2339 domain-containing protein [Sphingomonas psychrotolerans]